MLFRRILWLWRVQGLNAVLFAFFSRFIRTRAQCFSRFSEALTDAVGLEIGGPSAVFSKTGLFPVYPLAARLDNCNFSHQTIWEGSIKEGKTFLYDQNREPGQQFISEATNLNHLEPDNYDFVLSSHVIEHTTNPVLALSEWKRVMKERGTLVLIVPHKDGTFDHRRPITSFEHILQDFRKGTKEDDQTHVAEFLSLIDLQADAATGRREDFVERTKVFAENRCIHHHVFSTPLAVRLVSHVGFQVLAVEPIRPFHILIIAEKLPTLVQPQNGAFDSPTAAYRKKSPFPSDRRS